MALFKINKGLNANLPSTRHDGYAYFTTDDGKFWIDFQSPNGVQQADGTIVDRKALNAERADYVGYSLHLLYNGTETEDSFNGLSAVNWDLTPAKIGAFDIVNGSTVSGEAIFNNVVYLNDETYADSLTAENEIVTGTLRVVGDLNSSIINATTFNGALNGNATSATKVNHKLYLQINGNNIAEFDGAADATYNITPAGIGALSTSTNYAGSSSPGGAATSANKLNTNAGSTTRPVYFDAGIPKVVSNTAEVDLIAKQANKTLRSLSILFDGNNQVTFDGSGNDNLSVDITPEDINAVRRNGDTIAGPLTINGVFTVNNDTYIDSATIGDLLVNGGTRFVGAVTAGTITASSFVGPLTGNATSANKVNHKLNLQINGNNVAEFDGAADATFNVTPSALGALSTSTTYALGDAVGGNAVKANALNVSAAIGSTTRPVYIQASGVPAVISNTAEVDLVAKSANKVNHKLLYRLRGSSIWDYDGSAASGAYADSDGNTILDIVPNDLGIFDTLEGSTVTGEAVFNNIVYLNDETYADSLTAENEIVTGTLRVVGDLNGSIINATTFNGNATSASKVNHKLYLQIAGNNAAEFDGSADATFNVTASALGVLDTSTTYALGDAVGGNAVKANALNVSAAIGSTTRPVYIQASGVPAVVSNSAEVDIKAKSANKVNHKLTLQANGNNKGEFDGSADLTANFTYSDVGALADTTKYAGSSTQGGSATSAVKLDTATAGSDQLPVYFTGGKPSAISTSKQINILAREADKIVHKLKVSYDSIAQVEFDGSELTAANGGDENGNTLLDITPEGINAVRRNGDTIPGPLTLNGVFTVNNDAYIDSATIGDLLVNGGTRFVGAVNAGTITASSFNGPLTGNASTANKVNHALKIQFNGNEQCSFDGTALAAANGGDANGNTILNITPNAIGAVDKTGDTMSGALTVGNITVGGTSGTVAGKTVSSNDTFYLNRKANTSLIFQLGGTEHARFDTSGNLIPASGSTTTIGTAARPWANMYATTFNGNATSANKVNHQLKFSLRGTSLFAYDGSAATGTYADSDGHTLFDIVPNDLGIFDLIEGSTVSGEAVFNNVVYLNDETYADSLTAENEIVTGTLRVVGDLNGSVINATTFNGALSGNATSADKINHSLKFSFDGTSAFEYDGSVMTGTYADADGNTLLDLTPQLINAVDIDGSSTMTGTLKVDDTDGIKINSHNKDLKVWEVVGNAGSWNSQFGFYDLYKGTGSGNDNSLELYADNQSGTHVKVRTIKQDGTVNWHTVNTFDETIVGNIDTADQVNHSLNITFDSVSVFNYDGSALTGDYADEDGNSLLNITPEAINAVRRNGDTIPGPLTINGITTVNNDMYIDSATVGDLFVNGGSRFIGDMNAGNITASSFVGPLTGNATSANKANVGMCDVGSVAFYTDTEGTFGEDSYFIWDSTNKILTAEKLKGYVIVGQKSGTTLGTKVTAEGNNTTASGDYSHAEGLETIANHKNQHVFGEYNIADTSTQAATARGNYIEIVGNGTSTSARSNARTLDWNGNEVISGKSTSKGLNTLLATGSGTVCSTTSPYKPTIWTFNVGITPVEGDIITIKVPVAGTAYGTLLSLTNGASGSYHPVVVGGGSSVNLFVNSQYPAGALLTLIYESATTMSMLPVAGSSSATSTTSYTGVWRALTEYHSDSNTFPSAFCSTPGGTAAKTATCSSYVLTPNTYLHFNITAANTSAGAITMNVNSTGAKPIYINGKPSSATNYTLPAGSYIAYYDGTNWYFRIDGVLPSNDGFTKKAIVGSRTSGSSNQYYRFARVTATDTTIGASKSYRFRAYYKILGLYPGHNSTNGEFSIDFSITSDASSVATVTYNSLRWTYREWIAASTVTVRVGTTNKELNVYVWSGTEHYIYEIELLRIEEVTNANTVKRSFYAPVLEGTGYSIIFLTEVTSPTTTSTPAGTLQTTIENGHIGYANQATRLPTGGTLPTSPAPQTNDLFVQTNVDKTLISLPTGGTSGQMLYKITDDAGAASWINPNLYNSTVTKVFVTGCVSNTSRQLYNANIYMNMSTGVLMGAAWNDYAEFRQADSLEPGRCVIENGDDTLSLSTERMQPGAEIISDTYGFAIGETEKSKTPIAATGRVLAYPYENRKDFKPGMPVCSGPNGTVSIMTKEEARDNPWCIIGTVSAVPDYEVWGEKEVQVNGRIWIRIR